MAKNVIYSLYEKDYHQGIGALINSAIRAGFRGRFVIGYRDDLPPWLQQFQKSGDRTWSVAECELEFCHVNPAMHLGYYKPIFGRELAQKFPEAERFLYFDPDIVLIAPWEFFEAWISPKHGPCVCGDVNFSSLSSLHPWRNEWQALAQKSGLEARRSDNFYPNSGFIGVSCSHAKQFFAAWSSITEAFAANGGSTKSFLMEERWRAVVSDQDLLAATLQAWEGPISALGPEGMGFHGDFKFLCHAVEKPKPWQKCYAIEAIKGNAPSQALKHWLKFSGGPIEFSPKLRRRTSGIDLKLATLISRFWRR